MSEIAAEKKQEIKISLFPFGKIGYGAFWATLLLSGSTILVAALMSIGIMGA